MVCKELVGHKNLKIILNFLHNMSWKSTNKMGQCNFNRTGSFLFFSLSLGIVSKKDIDTDIKGQKKVFNKIYVCWWLPCHVPYPSPFIANFQNMVCLTEAMILYLFHIFYCLTHKLLLSSVGMAHLQLSGDSICPSVELFLWSSWPFVCMLKTHTLCFYIQQLLKCQRFEF